MFESEVMTSSDLDAVRALLTRVDHTADDATRITMITQLEALKAAAAAAQARLTADLHHARSQADAAAGRPKTEHAAGLADEIALARRDAPTRGNQHLGLALALVKEMPHTLAALTSGDISEWRATLLVRETAVLSVEHRREIDARLADELTRHGDRTLARKARALAYKLDPASALRRTRGAIADRRVTARPAPDTMTYLTAFIPAAQGIAAHQALRRHAATLINAGDPRTEAQIMADTAIQRLTGQQAATDVPIEVGLILTDSTLFGSSDEPAHLTGHGPIPASVARDLLTTTNATVWLRRLYTHPHDGTLVTMDSRRRCFTGQLRRFLITRDELCRTPWCDAPVRHIDHIHPATQDGPTTATNAQGLCARCNHTKNLPGWTSEVLATCDDRAGPHPENRSTRHRSNPPTVRLTTPTGHTHTSHPSPLLPTRASPAARAEPPPAA